MVDTTRCLTLVIPGLFGPAAIRQSPVAWQGLTLPALEGLLSRARRERLNATGLEQTLFALFNVTTAADADLPIAAVTRQLDVGDAGGYWWLRADPVHLRADRDRIVMMGNTPLNISTEECAQLTEEFNRHFSDEAWLLQAANARRWYLRLEEDPGIRTEALPDVVGQDILHHMPQGVAEGRWRSLLNEVQMILHASPVNQEREAQGLLPINSLWFWGGGRLPQVSWDGWAHVWANDALTAGLASLAAVSHTTLPEDAETWLGDDTPGHHLAVMDGVREKVNFDNVEGWREFLESLHDYWLTPLFTALKRGHLAELGICAANGIRLRITARDARRWWVRRQPLMKWA